VRSHVVVPGTVLVAAFVDIWESSWHIWGWEWVVDGVLKGLQTRSRGLCVEEVKKVPIDFFQLPECET